MHRYRLAEFLNKYNTVIFDMDGVVTSEQNYWNCAALTVYERLGRHFGYAVSAEQCMADLLRIRDDVFFHDEIIAVLKEKGVNSNWDLGYVVYCIFVILGTYNDFRAVYDYAAGLGDNILYEYDRIAEKAACALSMDFQDCRRSGKLWDEIHMTFQEWFLGDDMFRAVYGREPELPGKKGLIHNEKPIINYAKLTEIFHLMHERGMRICIGTGRPYSEIRTPLEKWGITKYIADDGFISYDHVEDAERSTGKVLTKPHPFVFLRAFFGDRYNDDQLAAGEYDKNAIRDVLVVGDAGADILAAKAMNADFAAVLTGVSGVKAKEYFQSLDSEYIFNSLEDFLE